jgi:tetratricopeptide (TPR) repeat protein
LAGNLDATQTQGFSKLATLYTEQGKQDQALGALQQAIGRAPLNGSLWLALGRGYTATGEYDVALSSLKRAAQLMPGSPNPLLIQGDVHLAQGNLAAAMAAFEAAGSVRRDDAQPLLRLSTMHELQGDLNQAEVYATEAITADPLDAAAYASLARILAVQDRRDEAIDAYLAGIQRDPRQVGAYDFWIRLHQERLRRFIDMSRLENALADIATGPEAETVWAQVALGLGHWALEGASDRVVAHFKQALSMDPVFSGLYEPLALAYEERLEGRRALDSWYRYLYGASQVTDTYVARAHIDWLLKARIDQPVDGAVVSGSVAIVGTAAREDFQFYKLDVKPAGSSEDWAIIGEAVYEPVTNGQLLVWPTQDLPPGDYQLRLTVVDITGNYGPHDEITVRVAGSTR